jgi:hypothetical protein
VELRLLLQSLSRLLSHLYSAIFTWPWPHRDDDEEDDYSGSDDSGLEESFKVNADIRVLSIRDGSVLDTIEVESENNVSCIVFARVSYRHPDRLEDCLLLGIDLDSNAPEYRDDFRDYNADEAEDDYEGNILPINLSVKGGEERDTWRGQSGAIRAMAVVPDKYLVSVSVHFGSQVPEKLIVWNLQDAGFPLRSITFFDLREPSIRPVFSELKGGIAICGSKILLCGNYGDSLLPFHLNESKGRLSLDMKDVLRLGQRYYDGDCFHGHMVGSGKDAILINGAMPDAWIYDIDSLGDLEPESDEEYSDEDSDEGEAMRFLRDRSRAIGRISFPRRGGAKEKKKEKKRKHGFEGFGEFNGDISGCSDNTRSGGPEVLAINGRYVLAGFRNGAIVQGKRLPSSSGRHLSREYGTLASSSSPIPQV